MSERKKDSAPRVIERNKLRRNQGSTWGLFSAMSTVLGMIPGTSLVSEFLFGPQKPRRRRRRQRKSQKTLIRKLVDQLPRDNTGDLRYFRPKSPADTLTKHPTTRAVRRRKRGSNSTTHDDDHALHLATLKDITKEDVLVDNALPITVVAAPVGGALAESEADWEDADDSTPVQESMPALPDEMAQLFAQIERLAVCLPPAAEDTPTPPLRDSPITALSASRSDGSERELLEQKAAHDLAAMMADLFQRTSTMVS